MGSGSLADANLAFQSQIRLDRPDRIGGHTKRPGGAVNTPGLAPDLEVQMPEDRTALNVWATRAVEALEQALDEIRNDEDALPSVSLANACLEAEQGLLDADELANLEYSYKEPECICPPDLLARGGFRGGCPVHG